MAVAYDADTQLLQQVSSSSGSFSHVCTGANRALVVYVMIGGTAVVPSVSSITYNGVALTSIGSKLGAPENLRIEAWGLANPASGSNTVAVTLSGSATAWDVSAISYTGAHQSGGSSTFNGFLSGGNTGTNTFVTVTVTSAVGAMVSSGTVSNAGNGTSPTSPGVQKWLDNSGSTNTQGSVWDGAATVAVRENWDTDVGDDALLLAAFNISAASAASGIPKTTKLTLLGVG